MFSGLVCYLYRMADLEKQLPPEVLKDRYCADILRQLNGLQHYMTQKEVGPQVMSRQQLVTVLGSLRPWELHSPEIDAAVQVIHCIQWSMYCTSIIKYFK